MWRNRGGAPDSDSDSDSRSSSQSVRPPNARGSSSARASNTQGRAAPAPPSQSSLSDVPPTTSHWMAKRHMTCGNPVPPPRLPSPNGWRNKTLPKCYHGAIAICLNPVVDPPEVYKTDPCAVLEAWVDPRTVSGRRASELIGQSLQKQFEGLNNRMKFKSYADPSCDDIERACLTLRKLTRTDRALFYYNGHGVPKPTPSGELWVFNKDYTQYIPLSITLVIGWLESPAIYIWDAIAAGNLLSSCLAAQEKRDEGLRQKFGPQLENAPPNIVPYSECYHLASCLADETLPMCPELPADLFTSCLTSPVDMSIRFFVLTQQLPAHPNLDLRLLGKIPGDLKDRRTPLGELNWILTAVTDTIAWTTFPRLHFQKLYRSDLMVAGLFRNFLLSERIMKSYRCTPHTYPHLPPANTHPMWAVWDLSLENCLKQVAELIGIQRATAEAEGDPTYVPAPWEYKPSEFFMHHLKAFSIWVGGHGTASGMGYSVPRQVSSPYLAVLEQQRQQFHQQQQRHRISNASSSSSGAKAVVLPGIRRSPEELPIILQVLLSNAYRVQALFLICQFMDLGYWAVHLCLLIGIFPYASRLLQAPNQELRAPLIFIWARLMAVDDRCRVELGGYQSWVYFANVLTIDSQRERERESGRGRGRDGGHAHILPNPSEHRAMCFFILAEVARGNPMAQRALCYPHTQPQPQGLPGGPPPQVPASIFTIAYETFAEPDYLLKQWAILCLAQLWAGNDEIKMQAIEWKVQDRLTSILGSDRSPEVRAACLFALGTLFGAAATATDAEGNPTRSGGGLGSMPKFDEFALLRSEITTFTGCTLTSRGDMSPMVRKELVAFLSCAVSEYRGWFIIAAWVYWEEEHDLEGLQGQEKSRTALYEWLERVSNDEDFTDMNRLLFSSVFTIFVTLLDLTLDPYPEVAAGAQTIVDWIIACLIESPFARLSGSTLIPTDTTDGAAAVAPGSGPTGIARSIWPTPRSRVVSLQSDKSSPSRSSSSGPKRVPLVRSNTGVTTTTSRVSSTLKRTGSLLVSYAFPLTEDPPYNNSQSSVSGTPRTSYFASTPGMDAPHPPSPNLNVLKYQSPYGVMGGVPLADEGEGLPNFCAVDCIEALIEEDWERLRARRHRSGRMPGDGSLYNGGEIEEDDQPYMENGQSPSRWGLGTGSTVRDVLPFRSRFYEWSKEYFIEPQMRQAESDEPGSTEYNTQIWRRQRNDRAVFDTRAQAAVAGDRNWERRVGTLSAAVPGCVMHAAFHAFDPYILLCNERQTICVWDWARQEKVQSFVNGNPTGTSITSLRWINEDIGGLVMAASADGIIKLYRNHDSDEDVQLVSGFRAVPDLQEVERGSGVVTAWNQHDGILLVGGDSRQLKIWNAHTEHIERDIATGSDSMITSIAIGSNHTFMASSGDGSIRIYDRRLDRRSPVALTLSDHTSWVQSVRWQSGGLGVIMSASIDGAVKLWDLRSPRTCARSWSTHAAGLSAFDLHEQASVFATSSAVSAREWRTQSTHIHSLLPDKDYLARLNASTGLSYAPSRLPSAFHASTSSLAFHPTEMLLATGGIDGKLRIAGCDLRDWRAPEPEEEQNGFPFPEQNGDTRLSEHSF